jgi:hypothetical protein
MHHDSLRLTVPRHLWLIFLGRMWLFLTHVSAEWLEGGLGQAWLAVYRMSGACVTYMSWAWLIWLMENIPDHVWRYVWGVCGDSFGLCCSRVTCRHIWTWKTHMSGAYVTHLAHVAAELRVDIFEHERLICLRRIWLIWLMFQQSDVETYLDRVVWGTLSSSFPLSDYGKSGKPADKSYCNTKNYKWT